MSWNVEGMIYSLALILIFIAAYIVYRIGQEAGETRRMRNSFARQWQEQSQKIRQLYADERLRNHFKRAGNPFFLNDIRFQLIRDAVVLSQLVILISNWVILGGSIPLERFFLIGFLYLILNTSEGMLVVKFLKFLAETRNSRKNREVFILYSLLLNEFAISGDKPNNLYSVMRKFRGYFPLLASAFDLFLLYYRKSPNLALESFAREIGTTLGRELGQILLDVDRLEPSEAYASLQYRYEHFNTIRLEENKRRLKDRGLLGFFVTFTPTLSIVYNFGYVYYLEYHDLIQFVNTTP